jgi:hypothetical protein
VQTRRSRTWVGWTEKRLPPGVKVGARVIAWGKLVTFGNARSFHILDSVLLEGISRVQIGRELAKLFEPYIVEGSEASNGHDQS